MVFDLHLPQNFCHTHTDTQHFPERVKPCLGHLKTCKSIKIGKSKICTKPILSSTYIEESDNNYQKKAKMVFSLVFRTYNCMCVFDINIHIDQGLPRIWTPLVTFNWGNEAECSKCSSTDTRFNLKQRKIYRHTI